MEQKGIIPPQPAYRVSFPHFFADGFSTVHTLFARVKKNEENHKKAIKSV
jgi:hypothetical protein